MIPQREPVCHPMPGKMVAAHAVRQIRAEPRERSGILQASIKLRAIGMTIDNRTVIEGVRAESINPIISQLTQILR
jgi:hypothetical protein